MKQAACTTTAFTAATGALLGVLTLSTSAAAQQAPAHQGAPGDPAPATIAKTADIVATREESDTQTQSPPGVVGANWPAPVEERRFSYLLVDQLEARLNKGADTIRWDAVSWYGGDYHRLWLKSEGDWRTPGERGGEAEAQVLYGKLIAPFWDLQIGLRYDQFSGAGFDRSRGFAVIGLQGLAPYRFEVEPALFISTSGDISARLTASNELLLTQRLILQPRLDLDAALRPAERFGLGDGLTTGGLGLRLRYEIRREFAPYVGIHWQRRFGETAAIARRGGQPTQDSTVVVGVRLWL